jgi:hypothetical protein
MLNYQSLLILKMGSAFRTETERNVSLNVVFCEHGKWRNAINTNNKTYSDSECL